MLPVNLSGVPEGRQEECLPTVQIPGGEVLSERDMLPDNLCGVPEVRQEECLYWGNQQDSLKKGQGTPRLRIQQIILPNLMVSRVQVVIIPRESKVVPHRKGRSWTDELL